MPNIIPLDFIDVSIMAAALTMKHSVHFGDDKRRQSFPGSPHRDTETILLRGPADLDIWKADVRELWQSDVEHADTGLLGRWASARAVIAKIAEHHEARSGNIPDFGKIMVVRLKAGGIVSWHRDEGAYAQAHDRFHLNLIPSPGARLYSGIEGAIPSMGTLLYFNNLIEHSAINMGPCDRVNLIVDIRKPEFADV